MNNFMLFVLAVILISMNSGSGSILIQENQNLAEWFHSQSEWDQDNLSELNYRRAQAYKEATVSVYSIEELMARNEIYAYWPDFREAQFSYGRNQKDLSCVIASSFGRYNKQVFYLNDGPDLYFVGTQNHEDIHTDVDSRPQTFNVLQIESSWGFNLKINDEWGNLKYFDESFVDVLKVLIMRNSGFEEYFSFSTLYRPGAEALYPIILKIMEKGASIQDLYRLHSESDIEMMLTWIGIILLEEQHGLEWTFSYENEEFEVMAIEEGYEFSLIINQLVVDRKIELASNSQSNSSSLEEDMGRPTCGMWLRFSDDQYQTENATYNFSTEMWIENRLGWWIIEEDYYLTIDQQ